MLLYLILAFLAGMLVMDLLWAYKLGAVHYYWGRLKARFGPKRPDYSQHTED